MGNKQDTTTKFSGWFYHGNDCQEVTPREIRGSHNDMTPCLLVNSYRNFGEALLTPPTEYNHTNTATSIYLPMYIASYAKIIGFSMTDSLHVFQHDLHLQHQRQTLIM